MIADFILSACNDISRVGDSLIIFVLIIVLVSYFLHRRDFLRVELIFLCLISVLVSTVMKGVFEQPRPGNYDNAGLIKWGTIFQTEEYSFPSTHTVLYTVFFGYLFFLSYRIMRVDKLVRHALRVFSALMVIFVGASRVWLGAHYTRDVVFGYLLGGLYLLGVIAIDRFLVQRREEKQTKRR